MSGRDIVSTAMRIARDHVMQAAAQTERKPSEAKVAAGNYKKGKLRWNGLVISIENAKGSIRRGIDIKGQPWQVTMPASYGYLNRSIGADTDHIDVYMGPNPLAQELYVIDQIDARTKRFDEHKVMAGFSSKEQAIETYKKAFSDNRADERIGAITKMNIGQFKRWLLRGDTTQPLGM